MKMTFKNMHKESATLFGSWLSVFEDINFSLEDVNEEEMEVNLNLSDFDLLHKENCICLVHKATLNFFHIYKNEFWKIEIC